MTYVQANTNGKLHAATEPSLSPLNRGFLYGDAIYEVWRTYDQVIFAWDEHWARLERSAEALFLSLPITQGALLIEIQRTVAEYRNRSGVTSDVYIRLQITRGAGAIGLDIALADASDYVILVQPNPQLSAEKLEQGQRLSIATSLRRNSPASLNPAWKTGNYLNNILCLREAKARGADEVVVTNLQGEITEAAVSNIGFVKAGVVITPPLAAGILEGVTRGLLIDSIAARAGLVIKEETVRPEDLPLLEECFLLSTTKDVSPVRSIDEHHFRVSDDSVTSRLKRAFQSYVVDYLNQYRGERSVAAGPTQAKT